MTTTGVYPFRSALAKAEYQALYAERERGWPVAAETHLVDTPAGQTFVRVSGRPTDPPLVLLPGSRSSSLMWIPNIATLSAHYRTYALDSIYDVGLSVRSRKISKPADLIRWLDEVLTVLVGTGSCHLAGISYGGWLASEYALRFPQRVHKLVLLAPAETVLPVTVSFIYHALLLVFPRLTFVARFLNWLLYDTARSGPDGRALVDQAIADWNVAQRCFAPLPIIRSRVLSDQAWHTFPVPVLFLVGEHEKMYDAHKAVARLNRVVPHLKAEAIPQAGHDLWMVQAERVNGRMLEFLGESWGQDKA